MQKQDKPVAPRRKPDLLVIIIMIGLFIGIFFFIRDALKPRVAELEYHELENMIIEGTYNLEDPSKVAEIYITPISQYALNGYKVSGRFSREFQYENFRKGSGFVIVGGVLEKDVSKLIDRIGTHNNVNNADNQIAYAGIIPYTGITFWSVLLNLLPWVAFGLLIFLMYRNAASQNNRAFDFAKSRARIAKKKPFLSMM